MGRVMGHRHRATSEAASIKAKTLFDYLVGTIKSGHEVSYPEAELIAADAWSYLKERHCLGGLGIIELPCVVSGEEAYFRRSRDEQDEKLVELPLIEDDDADLLGEFGMRTLMIGRMARAIEAAYYQGALLDYNRLCLLFPLNVTAVRERLEVLLSQGVKLPLAGTTQKTRKRFKAFRTTLALERYLKDEPLEQIRKSLALSRSCWRHCWNIFRLVVTDKEQQAAAIAAKTGAPEALIVDYLALWQSLKQDEAINKKVAEELVWPVESEESFAGYSGFVKLLVDRHGYTPAAAEDFTLQLGELAKEYGTQKERPQQITYIAVADSEGAGVSLKEARLQAVNLDYITAEDWVGLNRESPKDLKWRRIERFTVQAHVQGAALSLPDIAYLLSVSVDAVREAIKAHPQVLLPTRGRVADMGTTLSHAPKIIDLFMYGYTESEIARRTGHSLESIERYLLDFGKVVFLLESGMPAPAIRQVTGFSKKLTYKYLELYRQYATGDYVFGMGKVRRLAQGQLEKKNPNRKQGDRDDDKG
jgi:hypothetical protein